MQTVSDRLLQEQKRIIGEEMTRISSIILSGSINDLAQYKYHCGQLNAYSKVLGEHMTEANSIVDKQR